MVARNLARYDDEVMLDRYLPQDVAHTNRHGSGEEFLAILGYPDQVSLEVSLRVRAEPILSHATMLARD